MDELTGLTSPGPGGCDPSPGGEDRRITQTFHQVPSWRDLCLWLYTYVRT